MTPVAYLRRYVDDALDQLMMELPALMLTGPRGCGKTTTALRRATSTIRLDRTDEAQAFRASPDAVLAAMRPPVLIDEWQVVPDSVGAVKRAVDGGTGAGRFLVTGSVRGQADGSGWPGTGRIVPLAMYGLTVGEQVGSQGAAEAVTRLFSDHEPATGVLDLAPDLVDYLDHAVRGGFPEAVRLSDRARAAWYEGYVDQLIHHDLASLGEVRSPTRFAALLRAVALSTAGLPTIATLAEAADLDQRTVKTYLSLLEDLRIIERLPAWTSNRLNRLVKTPKYYVVDPGLAAHLVGDDRAGVLKSGDRLGRLIDTFVISQIRPLLKISVPMVSAYHLRDRNQAREVDMVLESASGEVVGIEVKAANAVDRRDGRHLAWLRDRLGPAFRRGVVLHTGSASFPLGDRLWAMPIATLWRQG